MMKLWEWACTAGNTKWRKCKRYHKGEDELDNTPMEYQLPVDTLEFLASLDKANQGRVTDEATVSASV
jgi:hypothetical protein